MYEVYPQRCEEKVVLFMAGLWSHKDQFAFLTCSQSLFQFSSTAVALLLSTVLLLGQVDVSGA